MHVQLNGVNSSFVNASIKPKKCENRTRGRLHAAFYSRITKPVSRKLETDDTGKSLLT